MTPVQAVSTCLRKYATFSGRASRAEFWLFGLFVVLAARVAGWVDFWIATQSNELTIHTLQRIGLAESSAVALRIFLTQPMGYFPGFGMSSINEWMGGFSFLSPSGRIAGTAVFLFFFTPTVSAICRRTRDAGHGVTLTLVLYFWATGLIVMHNLLFALSGPLNSSAMRSLLQDFSGPIISLLWPLSTATALCALYFLVSPSAFESAPSNSVPAGRLPTPVPSNPIGHASQETVLPAPTNQLPGPNPHEVTP